VGRKLDILTSGCEANDENRRKGVLTEAWKLFWLRLKRFLQVIFQKKQADTTKHRRFRFLRIGCAGETQTPRQRATTTIGLHYTRVLNNGKKNEVVKIIKSVTWPSHICRVKSQTLGVRVNQNFSSQSRVMAWSSHKKWRVTLGQSQRFPSWSQRWIKWNLTFSLCIFLLKSSAQPAAKWRPNSTMVWTMVYCFIWLSQQTGAQQEAIALSKPTTIVNIRANENAMTQWLISVNKEGCCVI